MKKCLKILFFFSMAFVCLSQTIDVPIELQVTIFNKVLSMERNINKKIAASDELLIGVAYQNKYRASLNAYNEVVNQYKKNNKFNGKKIVVKPIIVDNISGLTNYLSSNKMDILIVTPLKAVSISDISSATKNKKILSFSLVPDYIYEGLSVAVESKDNKAQILINLKAAKEEGADFSSHLLKIVKIIN